MQKTRHNARPTNSGPIIVHRVYPSFTRADAWSGSLRRSRPLIAVRMPSQISIAMAIITYLYTKYGPGSQVTHGDFQAHSVDFFRFRTADLTYARRDLRAGHYAPWQQVRFSSFSYVSGRGKGELT